MCMIEFSISSATSINFVLNVTKLYISCSKSIDKSSGTPPMRLQITSSPKKSTDVGSIILTKDGEKEKLKPVVFKITEVLIGANVGNFNVSVSEPGTVYFAALKIGTNQKKVLQTEIFRQSCDTCISYGSSKTFTINTISTIQTNITATKL